MTPFRRRWPPRGGAVGAAGVAVVVLMLSAAGGHAMQRDDGSEGLLAFALGDFDGVTRATLETNALPFKVVATALVLRAEQMRQVSLGPDDLPQVFGEFGFITPDRIANWPASHALPPRDRPLGMVSRDVTGPLPAVRIDAANLGCATCHSALLYDANGHVTRTAWIGAPNSSIDLEAYTQAVYLALGSAIRDRSAFRARIHALFPGMGRAESFTLRWLLLPQVAKRIGALQRHGNIPVPFSNGGAGRTNGVAALKRMLGVPPGVTSGHADVGFTSIPELSGRGFRSSLLYDGIYAPVGQAHHDETYDSSRVTAGHLDSLARIVAFFTVSTMGARPEVGERAIPAMQPVMRWIGRHYRSPPFPGMIDPTLADRGASVYGTRCANCHGVYGEGSPRRLVRFPNALIEQDVMRTDPARWEMIDSTVLGAIGGSAYQRHMHSARSGGYVAPILSGLWATAPYLHNGSVPTLWALLTPSQRPARFLVGGHALDYRRMGIALQEWSDGVTRYPAGYRAFSTVELFDTSLPGMSNSGHERQFIGMSDAEKWAVIEYLKTL